MIIQEIILIDKFTIKGRGTVLVTRIPKELFKVGQKVIAKGIIYKILQIEIPRPSFMGQQPRNVSLLVKECEEE